MRTDLGSTAIGTTEGLVLVDPVDLTEEAVAALLQPGPWVAMVLTNGNHARAAARFRSRFNVPVYSHPDAVGELEIAVDGVLTEGSELAGLRVLEVPGAGPGEIALWHEQGVLVVGDALVNLESTGLAVLPERYCEDATRLRHSLDRLRTLDPRWVMFAHGEPLYGEAAGRVRALIEGLPQP